jgi:hypothetical protein
VYLTCPALLGLLVLALPLSLCAGCGSAQPKGNVGAQKASPEGGAPEPDLRAFVECTLGFRVDFPDTATGPLQHETIDDRKRAAMVMRTGTGIGFSVTWTDVDAQRLTQPPMVTLRELEKSRLGKTGTLDEEKELSLPGGEALEFSFHRAEGTRERAAGGRVLLYLHGPTLYQVAALGDAGAGARPDATVFLSSFRPTTCKD